MNIHTTVMGLVFFLVMMMLGILPALNADECAPADAVCAVEAYLDR